MKTPELEKILVLVYAAPDCPIRQDVQFVLSHEHEASQTEMPMGCNRPCYPRSVGI